MHTLHKRISAAAAVAALAVACAVEVEAPDLGTNGAVDHPPVDSSQTIEDNALATEAFAVVIPEVFGAIGEAFAAAQAGSQGGVAPMQIDGQLPDDLGDLSQQVGDFSQKIEVDETVTKDGRTLSAKGVVNIAMADGVMTQTQDMHITWSDFSVDVSGQTYASSGELITKGDVKVDTASQGVDSVQADLNYRGNVTLDDQTFGFDVHITMDKGAFSYKGDVNGQTFDVSADLDEIGGIGGDTGSQSSGDVNCHTIPRENACTDFTGSLYTADWCGDREHPTGACASGTVVATCTLQSGQPGEQLTYHYEGVSDDDLTRLSRDCRFHTLGGVWETK